MTWQIVVVLLVVMSHLVLVNLEHELDEYSQKVSRQNLIVLYVGSSSCFLPAISIYRILPSRKVGSNVSGVVGEVAWDKGLTDFVGAVAEDQDQVDAVLIERFALLSRWDWSKNVLPSFKQRWAEMCDKRSHLVEKIGRVISIAKMDVPWADDGTLGHCVDGEERRAKNRALQHTCEEVWIFSLSYLSCDSVPWANRSIIERGWILSQWLSWDR